MSSIEINQVLAQMRALAAQAQSRVETPAAGATGPTEQADFSAMLKQSVDHVNALQSQASELSQAFELGDPKVDLTQVMVAMQKASVSFQAVTQVRNKLVTAYNEIMNMPI